MSQTLLVVGTSLYVLVMAGVVVGVWSVGRSDSRQPFGDRLMYGAPSLLGAVLATVPFQFAKFGWLPATWAVGANWLANVGGIIFLGLAIYSLKGKRYGKR